jgi:hypothetical protein
MSRRVYLSLALAVLCPGATVWAGPNPLGSPFPLSACADCAKQSPRVAGTPSGAFLAVWQGESGVGSLLSSVPGRLFTSAGIPQGGEFAVDSRAVGQQAGGAVAADLQGSFVVVWSAEAGGQSDVFAQRYTPRGRAVGPVIPVSADAPTSPVPPNDTLPAVAKSADGGFAVAWVSLVPAGNSQNGEAPRVLARRFSPAGAPLGPPVQVNTGLVSGDRPDLCVDTAGRPVVAWASVDGYFPFQPSRKGISARRLTPAGAPTGAEIVVSPATNGDAAAAVSCGPGNTFVVAWQGDQGPLAADRGEILAQRFTRLARFSGPAFRVNTATAGDQGQPRVAFDPTGAFVVVWQGRTPIGKTGVFARRFVNGSPTGTDVAVDFPLRDTLDPQPDVTPIGTAGNFLVVWRDGQANLFGQRFSP